MSKNWENTSKYKDSRDRKKEEDEEEISWHANDWAPSQGVNCAAEGVVFNCCGIPSGLLIAFHLGYTESLRFCMPQPDNKWSMYCLHIVMWPFRLTFALALMAICLPFALFHVFIASPIKLLRRTCNKNADHYYGPTCHPSCCSYNQLALTLEEEKRRPVLGCKHFWELLCCTVVINGAPYTSCPSWCRGTPTMNEDIEEV